MRSQHLIDTLSANLKEATLPEFAAVGRGRRSGSPARSRFHSCVSAPRQIGPRRRPTAAEATIRPDGAIVFSGVVSAGAEYRRVSRGWPGSVSSHSHYGFERFPADLAVVVGDQL